MHPTEQFLVLLSKFTDGSLTEDEEAQFVALIQTGRYTDWLSMDVQEKLERAYGDDELKSLSPERSEKIIQSIIDAQPIQQPTAAKLVHRVHFQRTAWLKYAAAILIILGAGTYLLTNTRNVKEPVLANANIAAHADIPPGGNKAILTLADGSKIILDDAANGNLAQQGSTDVVKLSDGQVAYHLSGEPSKSVSLNTMSTPAGGQYQVKLPDGTKVWLNAESSITYPIAFTERNRHVRISGEVYFEVAKDKSKPFIIDVDGKSSVEVLGTSFNINSYRDEQTIRTTLLEGMVRVSEKAQSVVLNPGQQAQISEMNGKKAIAVYSDVDMEQTLAWKNGLFNFSNADLPAVMRQLKRWYGIDVTYEGTVSSTKFSGKIYRNVHLSDVLNALERMGVNYRWQGKTLVFVKN